MWRSWTLYVNVYNVAKLFGLSIDLNKEVWLREKILRIFSYSVLMRKDTDQKNSEYGHFLAVFVSLRK